MIFVVSKGYDFAASGPGEYTIRIKPYHTFYYVESTVNGNYMIGSTSAALADAALSVSVSSTAKEIAHYNGTVSISGFDATCTDDQREVVEKTIPIAQRMTQAALEYVRTSYSTYYPFTFSIVTSHGM